MPRPHRTEALSDDARLTSDVCLSDVCLSVAYIGPKSRTQRPRKMKTGIEVAHVTRDIDTTFKVKRSKINLQGRGILWRTPAQFYFFFIFRFVYFISFLSADLDPCSLVQIIGELTDWCRCQFQIRRKVICFWAWLLRSFWIRTLTYITLRYAEGVLAPSAEAFSGPMRFPMSPLNFSYRVSTQ